MHQPLHFSSEDGVACLPAQDCQVSDDLNSCEQFLLWKELHLVWRCPSFLLWSIVCNVGMQITILFKWPNRKPINPSLFYFYFLVYLLLIGFTLLLLMEIFTRIIWKVYEIRSNAFSLFQKLEWAYYFELFSMPQWVLGSRLLNLYPCCKLFKANLAKELTYGYMPSE